jgi:hypothetical protein
MHLRFPVCLLFAIMAFCPLRPAFATATPGPEKRGQAAPPSPKDRAAELFDQATAAFDAGRFQEAEAKFKEAWALKQTHDIAGNLGIAEAHLGKNREAVEHLSWALGHLPPTESSSTRRGLEQERQKARAEIGALRVRVDINGAEITVNGRAAGLSPLAGEVFVEPGMVNVTVRRDGYRTAEAHVQVAKGSSEEVTIVLERGTGAAVTGVSKSRSIVPGIVAGGLAVGAAAAGVGLLVVSSGKKEDVVMLDATIDKEHRRCIAPGPIDPRCAEIERTARNASVLHDASVGTFVGAGVLAAGALVYLLWPAPKATKSGVDVHVAPVVGAGHGGLIIGGAF